MEFAVHEQILAQLREKVRTRQYILTLHAEEEMNDDGFSIFDVESGLLTGKIRERQKDQVTLEWKYLVAGDSLAGETIVVVTKISPTEKLVIITVWRE